MRKFFTVAAALAVGVLIFGTNASAQCDPGYVMANIAGNWKVNNAGGQGFGGVFSSKPNVNIQVNGRSAVRIESQGPFAVTGQYFAENNPQGGTWCAFTLDGNPARLAFASNNWWILEIGQHNDRNKIELIRR
jgi:hypothetical protein